MPDFIVRKASSEDAEAVMRLRKHIDKTPGNKNPPLDPYGGNYPTIEQQQAEIADYVAKGIFQVAVREEHIIGFAFCFQMHGRPGEYRLRFAVEKDWREKGVGSELIAQVVESAKNNEGIKTLFCSFHRSHKAAKHLLEKFGFKLTKQGLTYFMQAALYHETEMVLYLAPSINI